MWWLFNFPTVPGPTFSPFPFPLSPFPFPLSPFPFPLSPFPFPKLHKQIVCSNNQNQNQIEVVTYTTVNNRCAIAFQTGGLCFLWRLFSLGGGGEGGWKAPDSGGGGWVGGGDGWGGVSCEEFGVDNGGGGGHWTPRPTSSTYGRTAHTTSLIRHQTSDLIHIAEKAFLVRKPPEKSIREGVRDQKGVPKTVLLGTSALDTMCLCFLDGPHGGLL